MNEVTRMTEAKQIARVGNCTLTQKDERYHMLNLSSGSSHSISSSKHVTSQERLLSHWEQFCSQHLEGVMLNDITTELIKQGIAKAKAKAMREDHSDFCDGSGEIFMLDHLGERVHEGPSAFFSGAPSLKTIRALFASHLEAVSLLIEGQTRCYGAGNAIERITYSDPCDWWSLEVVR